MNNKFRPTVKGFAFLSHLQEVTLSQWCKHENIVSATTQTFLDTSRFLSYLLQYTLYLENTALDIFKENRD